MILSTIPEAVAYRRQIFVNVSAKFIQTRLRGQLFPFFWHLFNKLVTERTSGPKAFLLQRHILFSLRVKGGILNQAIYKKPHVVFHLEIEQNIHYSYAF